MTKGIAVLCTATFIYSFFGVLSRIVGYSIPLFYQNLTRNALAAFILFPIVMLTKQWSPMTRNDWLWAIARSIAGNIAFILFFIVVNKLPLGLSYFIFFGASTITAYAIGAFFLDEKITPIKQVSICFALLGLFLVYNVSVETFDPLYTLLAIGAGVTTSIWNLVPKKFKHSIGATQLAQLDNVLSVIFVLFLSLLFREPWTLPQRTAEWAASLGIGVLFVATGILVVKGFRYVDAQIGSIIMLSEILFTIVLAFFFYGETLSISSLIGGILIVTAIIVPEINWKLFHSQYAHRR